MLFEKFAIFVLFLGPLVFFHELGHFLFARLFGVRVEVFSIGFGPKLLKYRKGFTEYAVSLIPLGGYVKMFGDDPFGKDDIPQEMRKFSFTHQNKWARFWIVMGGPLANFILAFFVFAALLMNGEKAPEIKIGQVVESSKFYQYGIRTGDVLKRVNETDVVSPSDIMVGTDAKINSIGVERNGSLINIPINLKTEEFFEEFSKYPPALKQPVMMNDKGSWFWLSLSENPEHTLSLEEVLESSPKALYAFEIKVDTAQKPEFLNSKEFKKIDLKNSKVEEIYAQLRSEFSFYNLDLVVKKVNPSSPAEVSGMKDGDLATKFNGAEVWDFDQLRKLTQEAEGDIELTVLRNGEILSFKLKPNISEIEGQKRKLIGIHSRAEFIAPKFVETKPLGLFAAMPQALFRTWDTMIKTVDSFKKLIYREVSFKNIGGPLSIGKVASDSFNTSITSFLFLMAVISINLGVINLFPIPVLDGGHIMFIILEILNRGPISRRKMEIAQQVGLSLLLMLMVGALVNDFSRIL